jgi:hypothetical protein
MLRVAAALCMTALVPGIGMALPDGQRAGVGVNVGGWSYYAPDIPMIDQFKRAGGWLTQCSYPTHATCSNFGKGQSSWDTLEQSKMDVDEFGWPRSLPAASDKSVKYRYVSALMFQGNGRAHPAGKYTVLYEGKGTVEYGHAGTKVTAESAPGRDIVQVTNNTDMGLVVSITATDPADYVRNIRVLPPGGVCANARNDYAAAASDCVSRGTGEFLPFEKIASTTVWHPYYMSELRGFRSLRFLDWGQTNTTQLAKWTDRPRRRDAFWTGPSGVPMEAMIDLANTAGADPWITLSPYVDDDYAKNFGRRAKAVLGTGRNLILEYSNEPWNYGFPAAHWMLDQAVAKWPDAIAKGDSPYLLQYSWYGMRSAQICQIVKAQFGAEASRVKCVANTQAGGTYGTEQVLNCSYAAAELGKPCAQTLDVVAIAPYFGYYISDMKNRPTISKWYTDADGGLGKLFQEILGEDANGNKVTPPLYGIDGSSNLRGAVEGSKSGVVSSKSVATKFGLPLMAYEGGQHLTMAPGDTDAKWQALFIAANRDPRMTKAYTRMMENWQAAGGELFMPFAHIGKASAFGAWGLKEAQFTTVGVKWQAMLPYRDTKACWWVGCNN